MDENHTEVEKFVEVYDSCNSQNNRFLSHFRYVGPNAGQICNYFVLFDLVLRQNRFICQSGAKTLLASLLCLFILQSLNGDEKTRKQNCLITDNNRHACKKKKKLFHPSASNIPRIIFLNDIVLMMMFA